VTQTQTHTDAGLFINRELSWLEFNARVLAEAYDERNPLLERLKFLAIFHSNLDEFYMVRVAGLRRQMSARVPHVSSDGLSARQQLDHINRRVREMTESVQHCLYQLLLPALAQHGVQIIAMSDLTDVERAAVDTFFEKQVFPVLTPLAVDPGHPFPYISNLSLSLAVELRHPEVGAERRLARLKVPKSLSRWVAVPGRVHQYLPLEAVISAHLGRLFPGMQIVGTHAFRITRYSDLEIANTEEPEDLLATIEEQVFQRRFGEVVRLEVQEGMPEALRTVLLDELRETEDAEFEPLSDREVQVGGVLLDLSELMVLAGLDIPELRDVPFAPAVPAELRDADRSIFDVVRTQDLLVHHPFDSFAGSVEQFIAAASKDDRTLAIKMTLYRTSGDGAIVRALVDAAQRGIQVAVLVELQARFEETNNITWARTLESYGVHVAYGLPGLKIHAKTALVVRREADGIRRYVHLGTGNYNGRTARTYTDIGLITCSEAIGADVSDLFNALTGFSRQLIYRKLAVAPGGLRDTVIAKINREAAHARTGRPARIIAKMNALVDKETIRALYEASKAGVEIDLIIRGICCLRPGIPGVSERIRVISIVGRFLEHSRLWFFENDGSHEYWISSADWMPRNFDRRVEAATPIEDPSLHLRLRSLLETYLSDNQQAWELSAAGGYAKRHVNGDPAISTQSRLMLESWGQGTDTRTHRVSGAVDASGAHFG